MIHYYTVHDYMYMYVFVIRFPDNTFIINATQVTEMIERNIIAPFRFIKVGVAYNSVNSSITDP